jgi:CheY-like chemotaxis protein
MGREGTILVVDDDPALLAVIVERLGMAGYPVATASDRAEALLQAGMSQPALILCDIQMPTWGSGTDAYQDFRALPHLKDVPVIFMTGMPLDEAKKVVPFSDPLIRLMKKPLDWVMLEQAIQELTGQVRRLS